MDVLERDVAAKFYLDKQKTLKFLENINVDIVKSSFADSAFDEALFTYGCKIPVNPDSLKAQQQPTPNKKHSRSGIITIGNINPSKRGMAGNIYALNGISPTLTTNKGEGNKILVGNGEYFFIRKLTPLECFRLQGFPDALFYKAQSVSSDTQLYLQAGNSVSVPVVYSIAKNQINTKFK